uniref:Uncharacterized protein n=1 Tax=Anguilla anguilla TaxID=7936 RepID=A0A0E9UF57_ANGAN
MHLSYYLGSSKSLPLVQSFCVLQFIFVSVV